MADKKKAAIAKPSKKDARQQIEKKLATALAHLIPQLGEKKFKRRMKEAGKLILHGIDLAPKSSSTKKAAAKGPSKKLTKTTVKKKAKK